MPENTLGSSAPIVVEKDQSSALNVTAGNDAQVVINLAAASISSAMPAKKPSSGAQSSWVMPEIKLNSSYPGIPQDAASLDRIAQTIWQAGEGMGAGTRELEFLHAIAGMTSKEWAALSERYAALYGPRGGSLTLGAAIREEFDGDLFSDRYRAMAHEIYDRAVQRDADQIYIADTKLKNPAYKDLFLNLATTHNLGQKLLMHQADIGSYQWYRFNSALKEQFLAQAESSIALLTEPSVAKRFPALAEKMTDAVTLLWGTVEILREQQSIGDQISVTPQGAVAQFSNSNPALIGNALGAIKVVAQDLARSK